MDEQAPVRRQHHGPRERPHVADRREHLRRPVDVADLDAVRARERQDREVAERAELDVHRLAAVVEIDAIGDELLGRSRVDDGRQRSHRRVVGDVPPIAQLAAHDVVLLPRDPRLPPVGRERDREQVVGKAARLQIAVHRRRVEREADARRDRHRRRVDLDDLAAGVRRDEACDVDVLAVVRDGDRARPRTDVDLAHDRAGGGIELEQLADGHQADVRGIAGRAHRDRDRLGRVRQPEPALDDEAVRIDDGDRVVVFVDDPELSVRQQRQRFGTAIDIQLGQRLQLVRVDGRDGVVVVVDDIDAPARAVVDDRRRRRRTPWRQRVVDEVLEERACHGAGGVGRQHVDVVEAGRREGV